MPLESFHLGEWSQSPSVLAAEVPVRLLRGLFTRKLEAPVGTAALVLRQDGSRRAVREGGTAEMDDAVSVVFVRTGVFEMNCEFPEIPSADGPAIHIALKLAVQVGTHESDLVALRDRLLAREPLVDRSVLRPLIETPVREAVRAYVALRPAEKVLSADLRAELTEVIRATVGRPAFEHGLLTPTLEVAHADSPEHADRLLEQDRRNRVLADEQLRREIDKHRHDGRVEQVKRLDELAGKLAELRGRFPEASMENLVRQLDEGGRGELFDALLGLYPEVQPCRRLYVAAGRSVYGFDPPNWSEPADRIDAPQALGSVRSVRVLRAGGGVSDLGLGCQYGVALFPGDGTPAREFPVPVMWRRRELKGGVNSIARLGKLLFATHSEIGLLIWEIDRPDRGAVVNAGLAPAQAVRCATADSAGRLLFTWDRAVVRLAPEFLFPRDDVPDFWELRGRLPEFFLGSPTEITCLLAGDGRVLAGNAGGQVLRWPEGSPGGPSEEFDRSSHRIQSLAPVTLGNVNRLLIGDGGFAIRVRIADERRESRYRVSDTAVGTVAGSSDFLFGADVHGSRVFVWKTDDSDKPVAEIPVRRLAQHSIKDLAVLTTNRSA